MIKITYKESSIECSTKEEARDVLHCLNEIRKENAKVGLTVHAKIEEGVKRQAAAQKLYADGTKPKPN